MAISFTRPDPSSPSAVASAAFTTARKGYEQSEVREFLRMVAAELARLQEREKFLEREMRSAQRSVASPAVALDDEVVTRMLGEEAVRILHTARDAATQIRLRAEEGAARLLREATDEAQRLREEAEVESSRRRNDAAADAEAELQMAKQQGRDMVNEARAYRERVLNELARRREMARQQIEQLIHGRDRLLQAFERARLVSMDVMAELTPLGEPDEYVDLSPTTGPVPVMVPAQPPAVAAAPEPARESIGADETVVLSLVPPPPDDDETVEIEAELPSDAAGTGPDVAVDAVGPADAVVEDLQLVDDDDPADATAPALGADAPDGLEGSEIDGAGSAAGEAEADADADAEIDAEAAEAEIDAEAAEAERGAETRDEAAEAEPGPVGEDGGDGGGDGGAVVELFPGETAHPSMQDAPEPGTGAGQPAAPARASVDDLFARLRASRPDAVAARVAADPAPSPPPAVGTTDVAAAPPAADRAPAAGAAVRSDDSVFNPTPEAPELAVEVGDTPFDRRDEALTPVIVTAARKLKRVLADEQNEVLHTLRGKEAVRTVEALLPALDVQAARYADAVDPELVQAATAGAASMGDGPASRVDLAAATRTAREALLADLVAPLRDRLGRCVADADGDNAELATLVRTAYREWKNQRIDEHLDDVARAAFGRGALAAVEPGTPIRWIVDPNGPACPDAEDNALAGAVAAGEAFPTDHRCAPAHGGCRCMIAPAGD